MTRDLDAVLASIDGALADAEFPDAMRWSPEPATVDDAPEPYDGDLVWQPPQRYEEVDLLGRSAPWGDPLGCIVADPPRPWTDPASSPLDEIRRAAELYRRPPRGLPVDHLIVDELYLVDPAHRAEVEEERRRTRDRLVDRIAVGLDVPREWLSHPSASEVAVRNAAEVERAWQGLREVFAATVEQLRPVMEFLGRAAAAAGVEVTKFVEAFTEQALAEQNDRPPPPLPDLRRVDPQGYALQLRQSRGTGPDRQVQRQHRPRRHR